MTGRIVVSDDCTLYDVELRGEWTLDEVRAAFADGYDWAEAPENASFEMIVFDAGDEQIGTLTIDRGKDYGTYPHPVEW